MAEVTMRLAKPVIRSFPVSGQTGEELLAALRELGHAGLYRPNLALDYAPMGELVTVVRIAADPAIRLPEWKGAAKAEAALRKGWDRTLALVTDHEKAHHRDFVDRIKAFAKAVGKDAALTVAALKTLVDDYQVKGIIERNELHDRRLERDWRKIEKFLCG